MLEPRRRLSIATADAATRARGLLLYFLEVTAACEQRENIMSNSGSVIVVHYHELWLKGRNRRFFLGKLFTALRQALGGIPVRRIEQPGDRFVVRLGEGAAVEEAVARPVERSMEALCEAAWEEVEPLRFASFAVRAKRSDKSFAHPSMEIASSVG